MNILNALHTLLQGHPQQAHPAQAVPEAGYRLPGNAQPRAYMQAAPMQPMQHMAYRLPMNPDGSGGGFAPRPASSLHHLIHGPLVQQHGMSSNFSTPIQGIQNPGATPMQQGQFNRYMPIQNGYNQNIQ